MSLDAALEAAYTGPCLQDYAELHEFGALLLARQAQRVLEIGGHCGGTARFFLGLGCQVGCIEPEPTAELRALSDLRLFHGPSQDVGIWRQVEDWLGDDSLDVLFIDGDHRLSAVTSDFEMYAGFVKPGGLVAFHDVVRWPDNRQGLDRGIEVPEFWEALPEPKYVMHYHATGMGIGWIEV